MFGVLLEFPSKGTTCHFDLSMFYFYTTYRPKQTGSSQVLIKLYYCAIVYCDIVVAALAVISIQQPLFAAIFFDKWHQGNDTHRWRCDVTTVSHITMPLVLCIASSLADICSTEYLYF